MADTLPIEPHGAPGITTIPHPMTFEAARCTCEHEDWQHSTAVGMGRTGCVGGRTAEACPCTARWRRVLP
jgi:hypothetical protein